MVHGLAIWEQVVNDVNQAGQGMTRAEVAAKLGVTKATATTHLEKGVQRGRLQKIYTNTSGHYRGWVYLSMGTLDSLETDAS